MKSLISLNNVYKIYDKRSIAGIHDITLKIDKSLRYSLVGPSGSGKTTLLKLISKTIEPDKGEIHIAEKNIIAYVPQNSELDHNKTLFENVEAEILFIEDEEKRINQVRSTLDSLELTNEVNRYPNEISGGQQQRAIIAKALVKNPTLVLLDEPFGHLDNQLRFDLMQELFGLFEERQIATVWVTHDLEEAMGFSDRIIVLNHGRIQQIGTPKALYQMPENMFVANFFGKTNLIASRLIDSDAEKLKLTLFKKEILIPRPSHFISKNHGDVLIVIRPEHLIFNEQGDYSGKIKRLFFMGAYQLALLTTPYQENLWINLPGDQIYSKDQKIRFSIETDRCYCLSEL